MAPSKKSSALGKNWCSLTGWVDDYITWSKSQQGPTEAELLKHDLKFISIATRSFFVPVGNFIQYFLLIVLFTSPNVILYQADGVAASLNIAFMNALIIYVLYVTKAAIMAGTDPNLITVLSAPFWSLLRAPSGQKWNYFKVSLPLNFFWYAGLDVAFAFCGAKFCVHLFGTANVAVPVINTTIVSMYDISVILAAIFVLQTAVVWLVVLGFGDEDGAWLGFTSAVRSRFRIDRTNEMYAKMVSLLYLFLFLSTGLNFPPDPLYLIATYLATLSTNSYGTLFEIIFPSIAITACVCAFVGGFLSTHVWRNTRWFESKGHKKHNGWGISFSAIEDLLSKKHRKHKKDDDDDDEGEDDKTDEGDDSDKSESGEDEDSE
jgi:hypothetical protein